MDMPMESELLEKQNKNQRRLMRVLLGGLFVALVVAGYFYWQWHLAKNQPNQTRSDETKAVIEAVSELLVLPQDEQPTIATVTDPDRLKDQPFFANAKKGNKVLIYTKAKKAILYDPAANKIVEVAPLNIGETGPSQSNLPSETGLE